jgi:hypothetical protein
MRKPSVMALIALLFSAQALTAQTAASTAQKAETRLALVIGNGTYPNVPLKNPPNDARDLAAALGKLGFSVNLVIDGDMAAMTRALRDFGAAIKRPDAVALFYYSGHGVQYRGANYLIPAKSDIQDPDELAFSAVNAEQVYAKMESSGDKTNIVVLDACRNNPFPGAERASERGLAVVGAVQPPQSLIVYATAPGKTAQDGTGRNGAFSAALLKHIADPGLDVELMFRRVRDDVIAATDGAQVPWANSSISGAGFVFAPAKEEPVVHVSKPQPQSAAAGAAGTGTLRITSDPPGMMVSVDGAEALETPLSLDLPPGAHSFEPQVSTINRLYYAGEQKQWITVSAGSSAEIPLHPRAAEGNLLLKLVPEGYTIFINDERLGESPIQYPAKIQAGLLTVRFEKEGEPPKFFYCGLQPGETATLHWGNTIATAVRLERKTVKLEAKPDSWEGIEPLYELDSSSFMGDKDLGITKLYLCRDDKYLYWRVDFRGANPFLKLPKGIGRGIDLQVTSWMEGSKKSFDMKVQYNREANKVLNFLGSYNASTRKYSNLAAEAISTRQGKDMLVARLDWSWVEKHVDRVGQLVLTLANIDDKWQWVNKEEERSLWIDFTK